ncbi:MAG: glucose-6-phosphate 1-epimerase [Candidatus Azotimanducaceae bacterium]|jgi:glucose-6-phosphate 1-epimerase
MQLSNSVELQSASNQVDILVIDNDLAKAQISLHGGHILSFKPKSDNRERLWVSQVAVLDGTKPIRGGIPICWPWFGAHPSKAEPSKADLSKADLSKADLSKDRPAHGYVRTQQWHLIDCVDSDIGTVITLKPESAVNPGFDVEGEDDVDLQLMVSIGHKLEVQLTTKNTGAKAFKFGGALHSYFNVEDIRQTQLHGLSGDYLDKTLSFSKRDSSNRDSSDKISFPITTPENYRFQKETDNIHLTLEKHFTVRTASFSIDVESQGHDSIVVWNPWIEKSIAMADMQDGGYQSMLCVEAAITQGVILAPNEQHTLTQIIQ